MHIRLFWVLLLPVIVMLVGTIASLRAQESIEATSTKNEANDRELLLRYATDTWKSFDAMLYGTSIPADNVDTNGVKAKYTSPTNIAVYIWSTLAARDLGFIDANTAAARMSQTLATLASLERHEGMFYNWYDPSSLNFLVVWPDNGDTVQPFLSSIDNAWLATALMMIRNAEPSLAADAEAILADMDFAFFYDKDVGRMRGGYWPNGNDPSGEDCGGYTCFHFGALNSESRMISYVALARGDVPTTHYYRMERTPPDTCDWSWQEMQPQGTYRTYQGIKVYEGVYEYRGIKLVPSWDGSMFEALMPTLLVPEAQWGQHSWGLNHPRYVKAHIEHGLKDAQYGYWGFSPAINPSFGIDPNEDRGYREYGVDAIGLWDLGYTSNNDNTTVDYGFGNCRDGLPVPGASAYTNGVVVPYASFLALEFAPENVLTRCSS